MRLRHKMHEQEMGTLQELRQPCRTKGFSEEMKAPSPDRAARIIEKLELDLSILTHQETLWRLRAKAKRLRIAEVKRQISQVKR